MVATVTDEQSAARELVRGWARTAASGAAATAAVRDMEYGFEEGNADAWRPVFAGLAGLGLFGVAVPEDCGGAGGSIEDCVRWSTRRPGRWYRGGRDHRGGHFGCLRSQAAQRASVG